MSEREHDLVIVGGGPVGAALAIALSGSGYDVLRALHARLPEVEFYMLSSFAEHPYQQLAERLGAKGYFDKTRDFESVRDLVAQRAAALTH